MTRQTTSTPAGLFLREHATLHSSAVVPGNAINTDHVLDGLSDDDLRARPHDLNPIAWLLWHIARVEDSHVGCIIAGQPPLLADTEADWAARLGVARTDVGEGMTSAAVGELAAGINLAALREYRDAVGRRTRELVQAVLWPDRWTTPLTKADMNLAVDHGVITPDEARDMTGYLGGMPRDSVLWWWGINHSFYHLGQIALVRGVVLRGRT